MACSLSTGRKVPCKSAVGGIKNIFFADFGTLGSSTIVAGEITAITGTPDFFKFEVKGASSLETAINSSRENGTTFYESTLTMALTFQDKATQEELKLIVHWFNPRLAQSANMRLSERLAVFRSYPVRTSIPQRSKASSM